jgi:hypothetical protein
VIIKYHKGFNTVIVAIVVSVIVIAFTFNSTDFRIIDNQKFSIIILDVKQKIMTLDLGISSSRNLLDDGTKELNYNIPLKLIALTKKIPDFFHYKFFDKEAHKFEKIYIDIKFKDYQKIMSDRSNALRHKQLSNPTTNNATLKYKNNIYNAKIRLKGDQPDHWNSKYRMSFKIRLKNDKTILGFNEFSIQKPNTRFHPYDYTFQSMLRETGNLTSVHKFAHIFVNGEDWGIMDIEEFMSKELLEKQNRKNSVIFRFSNDEKWFYETISKKAFRDYRLSDPSLYSQLYNKRSLKDIHNRKVYSYISNNRLINNYNIYDIDSFSKALILSLIWNSTHTLMHTNSRFYFNPYTLKLESITTDQQSWYPIQEAITINPSINSIGNILSNQSYLKNLSTNLKKVEAAVSAIEKSLSYPQSVFPVDIKKNTKTIEDNLKEILNNKEKYLISPIMTHSVDNISFDKDATIESPILPTKQQASEFKEHIHIRHYTDGTLELYNLLPDNVTVKDILFDNNAFTEKEIIVPSYLSNPKPTILKTPYQGIQDDMLIVNTEYQGFERAIKNGITLVKNGINNPLLLNTTHKFDFINQLDNRIYEINSGNWLVNQPIIVEGDLHISPGVNLQFSKDSYLIVKGSLTAIGGEANPIIFKAISDSWKGIYVLNADTKSHLKNVNIIDVSALEDELLKLTGGITFYKSDIDFEDVRVSNVKAEDAINIVDSSFSFNSVFINNTISDGLDSDFSEGNVLYSEFINIGGDALDFSGSNVYINQTKASDVKDKAVSAGEESILNIENSNFSNIGIGVASKDGSQVSVFNTLFKDVTLSPAMTFIKKSFYEAPKLVLKSCDIDIDSDLIAQTGTSIFVDGVQIKTQNINVEKLYQSNVMRNE